MSFKGEIALGALNSKYKYGFTVGDIYRVQGAGNLVPNNLAVANGAFVEWTSDGWEVKKDMQYAVSKTGESLDDTAVSLEEIFFANSDVPASTLRFSFGDPNYDPTTDTAVASRHNTADRAGGGTPAGYGGTWTKLKTKFANIWDYTYVDNTLLNEFDNGNYAYEATPATRFWNDVEHNPIKIIASNTSGCTSFKRAFQGCWAITEIWNLDTSDALNMQLVLSYCKNLRNICKLDCSSCKDIGAMFQYCFNIDNIELVLIDDDSINNTAQNLFLACESLTTIKGTLDFKSVTNAQAAFAACTKLTDFVLENTDRIKNMSYMFAACCSLSFDFINAIDTSSATTLNSFLAGYYVSTSSGYHIYEVDLIMANITEIPSLDFSSSTDCGYIFLKCDIQSIDATKISVLSGDVKINHMFEGNRNCKSGILDAYTALNAVTGTHAACFRNCGIDTAEGRAELEQIPASWGGLAP